MKILLGALFAVGAVRIWLCWREIRKEKSMSRALRISANIWATDSPQPLCHWSHSALKAIVRAPVIKDPYNKTSFFFEKKQPFASRLFSFLFRGLL